MTLREAVPLGSAKGAIYGSDGGIRYGSDEGIRHEDSEAIQMRAKSLRKGISVPLGYV